MEKQHVHKGENVTFPFFNFSFLYSSWLGTVTL